MQLAEEDELIWQDGTANPETCIDKDNLTVVCSLHHTSVHSLGRQIQPFEIDYLSYRRW